MPLLVTVVLCLVAVAVGLFLAHAPKRKRAIRMPPGTEGISPNSWQKLLKMCNNDKAAAFRMIALEQKKNPKLSKQQAASNAIYKHTRR